MPWMIFKPLHKRLGLLIFLPMLIACSEGFRAHSGFEESGSSGRLSAEGERPLLSSSQLKLASGPYEASTVFSHDAEAKRVKISIPLGPNAFVREAKGAFTGSEVRYVLKQDEAKIWWSEVELTTTEWQNQLASRAASEPVAWLEQPFLDMGPSKLYLGLGHGQVILKFENPVDPHRQVDFPVQWAANNKVFGSYTALPKDERGGGGLQLVLNLE